MKIIKIANNPNIRDIGGRYKHVHIKEGMLVRGRTLRHLTEDQKAYLVNECHVKTIIDLRSDDEQNEEPELNIEGAVHESIPIFQRQKEGISHNEKEKADALSFYRYLPTMDKIYYDMLHDQSLINIGLVINRIVTGKDDEYGFYFHCSEGKDRTGLISGILLLILGVSRREIIKEYLVTNKMSKWKAFRYYMRIKYLKFDPLFALKVGRTVLAKRKYIKTLFKVIDDEYGSLDAFLTNGLHIDLDDVNAFRDKLIMKE